MRETIKSYDPSSGALIGEVIVASDEEVKSVVEVSKTTQKIWRALTKEERLAYIEKAWKQLGNHAKDLGVLLSKEMGKDLRSGMGEVAGSAANGPHIAKNAMNALKSKVTRGYGSSTTLEYVPLGVCAVISPWNFPVAMANNLIVPALIAGNTVVLKPSEETPLIAQAYVNELNKVLPEGVLQIIHGHGETGKHLVESDVNIIAFTGSQAAGRDIMKRASKSFKRLVMELGGNDPLIVLKDADIEESAAFAVGNSVYNAGQVCTSTERIYVHEDVSDRFIKAVCEIVKYYKVGPYNDPTANVGPIINEKQRSKILHHIQDAISKGAKIEYGDMNHPDRYINPMILSGMTKDMLIEKEETFGPIVCISTFNDVEDVIERANDTVYGLGASVYGHENVKAIAGKLEAGMIGINSGTGGAGDTPWVGAKQSGFGYHGSPNGYRQFAQVRILSE